MAARRATGCGRGGRRAGRGFVGDRVWDGFAGVRAGGDRNAGGVGAAGLAATPPYNKKSESAEEGAEFGLGVLVMLIDREL